MEYKGRTLVFAPDFHLERYVACANSHNSSVLIIVSVTTDITIIHLLYNAMNY